MQDGVGEQVERRIEPCRQGAHLDRGVVAPRPGGEAGALIEQLVAELEGVEGGGAVAEQGRRQPGGAGLGELVGGRARVEQEVKLDQRQVVPLRQDHLQPVGQGRALELDEARRLHRPRRRRSGTVKTGRAGGEARERGDVQHKGAVAQPSPTGVDEIRRRRAARPIHLHLPGVRGVEIGLRGGQGVGLAAEAAYPLDPAQEQADAAGLHPLHFFRRRPVGEQARQLLVEGLFDPRRIDARLGGDDDLEQAGELPRIDARAHARGDLVLIDEALVEA